MGNKLKTWLTGLFCVVRCILFPKTKICVASSTRTQANEVLSKIVDDFMKNYGWGSENLCREITYYTIGLNKAEIDFANGSWIKVVTSSDSGRGNRANVLVMDEFRMLDKKNLDTVLKRFMGDPRQPAYINKPEYKDREDLLEQNIEIYMSSCWMKSHWSFEKSKAYTVNLLGGRAGYFVCAIPYQMAIKERLKKRSEIEDEMSETDFDQTTFDMEMGCMPFGDTDGAFFSFEDLEKQRKLKYPVYPPKFLNNKIFKVPELTDGERRIMSVDVALMASTKHNNDATSVIINRAIPSGNSYRGNEIFITTYEGLTTDELAVKIRRMFEQYHCTDMALDCSGVGLGLYDALIQDIIDPENGEIYKALSCCNNQEMAARCKVEDAPKVIWAIKANATFNTDIAVMLRGGIQQGKMNLLVSEYECEELLKDKISNFDKLTDYEQVQYKMPYVQTTLLIYELIGLEHEVRGTNIKLKEKTGARKDRYSSLAYNYWVQCELERENLRKPKSEITIEDFAKQLGGLNHRPNMY